jgi:hypothetical protein
VGKNRSNRGKGSNDYLLSGRSLLRERLGTNKHVDTGHRSLHVIPLRPSDSFPNRQPLSIYVGSIMTDVRRRLLPDLPGKPLELPTSNR